MKLLCYEHTHVRIQFNRNCREEFFHSGRLLKIFAFIERTSERLVEKKVKARFTVHVAYCDIPISFWKSNQISLAGQKFDSIWKSKVTIEVVRKNSGVIGLLIVHWVALK